MSTPRAFADTTRSALVIAFPPGVSGLFNPNVHGLVRRVQEELPGVYVSYALTSGSAPTLNDALAAARFQGCQSPVVVYAGEGVEARWSDQKTDGDWLVSSLPVPDELDVTAVVNAFNSVAVDSDRAA